MQAHKNGEQRPIAALPAALQPNHHQRKWLALTLAFAALALMLISVIAPVRAQVGLCVDPDSDGRQIPKSQDSPLW